MTEAISGTPNRYSYEIFKTLKQLPCFTQIRLDHDTMSLFSMCKEKELKWAPFPNMDRIDDLLHMEDKAQIEEIGNRIKTIDQLSIDKIIQFPTSPTISGHTNEDDDMLNLVESGMTSFVVGQPQLSEHLMNDHSSNPLTLLNHGFGGDINTEEDVTPSMHLREQDENISLVSQGKDSHSSSEKSNEITRAFASLNTVNQSPEPLHSHSPIISPSTSSPFPPQSTQNDSPFFTSEPQITSSPTLFSHDLFFQTTLSSTTLDAPSISPFPAMPVISAEPEMDQTKEDAENTNTRLITPSLESTYKLVSHTKSTNQSQLLHNSPETASLPPLPANPPEQTAPTESILTKTAFAFEEQFLTHTNKKSEEGDRLFRQEMIRLRKANCQLEQRVFELEEEVKWWKERANKDGKRKPLPKTLHKTPSGSSDAQSK